MGMTIRKTFFFLLLILIIAGFLRLYHITTVPPGLYPDEAMNGNNALQALNTPPPAGGFKVFYPENNGREGLFMNIQALSLKFFGVNEPWALRLPSNIFGILTVLGIYFLAKELFSIRVGLVSAFFLATSFWHINFSHIGFRAIMAPFFAVWALYFLLKAIRSHNTTHYIPPTAYSIIGGVFYGLGFYSYISYRVTPLLLLLFVLFFAKEKGFWKVIAIFLITTFFVALPIGLYFLQHPADFMGRTTQVSVFSSPSPLSDLAANTVKTLGMFNFKGDGNWRHNYSGSPELFWPVGILMVVGLIIGLRKIAKNKIQEGPQNRFAFLLTFLWFLLAMLPVVISNEGIPHALRSILMIPPVIILAGVGGIAAYDFLKKYIRTFLLPAAATVFLAILTFQGYYSYFVAWANNPNVPGAFAADYVELGRKLNSLPVNIPKYIVVQAGGVSVNGMPMPTQTVMFITGTFLPEWQKAKNIYYVLPDEEKNIPAGAEKFYIR